MIMKVSTKGRVCKWHDGNNYLRLDLAKGPKGSTKSKLLWLYLFYSNWEVKVLSYIDE